MSGPRRKRPHPLDGRPSQPPDGRADDSQKGDLTLGETLAKAIEREWTYGAFAWLTRHKAPGGRRTSGRPPWRRSTFFERYQEAVDATPEPRTDTTIAANFRRLGKDGTLGIEPDSLARLRRKAESGDMPE